MSGVEHGTRDVKRFMNQSASGRCPICPETDLRCLTEFEHDEAGWGFSLTECRVCRLVKINHTMEGSEFSQYVEEFHRMIEQGIDSKRDEKALKPFRKRAALFSNSAPGKLLDVGCGPGYFLQVMQENGWSAHGIEPGSVSGQYATDTFQVPVFKGKLEQYDEKAQFDLITLWHVLEHLDELRDAMDSCSRLLKPGGVLFAEVPNIDSFDSLLCDRYWLAFRDPTHRWMFRPGSLERLATGSSLDVIRVEAGSSVDHWYGLKRGVKGRICHEDRWQRKMHRASASTSIWRKLLGEVVGSYPFMRLLAWLAGKSGRGDVLRLWCRKGSSRC